MTSIGESGTAKQPTAKAFLSQRVGLIKISPTIAISERAAALTRSGRDVISMSLGEMDFDTPERIITAAHDAALRGLTRYTAPDGALFVKSAVRTKLMRDNALDYAENEIHVVSGCKQVIYNALAASLNRDDEVVLFSPYWVSYSDMVEFCDGKPVIVPTRAKDQFLPKPEALAAAIGPRTKWVFLNSPNNPTGAVYPPELLTRLAEVLRRHPHVMILSDEIYEHLIYDSATHCSIINVAPDLRDRVLVVNGVSKTYAMTGWRIGFGAGPRWLIDAMAKVQSQTAGSSNTIGQAAAAEAMTGDQTLVSQWRDQMQLRRDRMMRVLKQSNRFAAAPAAGAFYVFLDVSRCIGARTPDGKTLQTDTDVAEFLLLEAGVAVVPGEAFGASPFLRLSFALDVERLEEACSRMVSACGRLTGP